MNEHIWKMLRIFTGLLLISLINASVLSWQMKSLMRIGNIFEWPAEIYHLVDQYKHLNTTRENIEKILLKVGDSASQLKALDKNTILNCRKASELLFEEVLLDSIAFQNPITELCRNVEKVNHFFVESEQYKYDGLLNNETFGNFAHKVLWGDSNLPDSLDDIHESLATSILNSRSLSHMFKNSKGIFKHDCDTHASAQQQVYNIYVQLIIAEMKGLVTIQQIYLTKRLINQTGNWQTTIMDLSMSIVHYYIADSYIAEMDSAKQELEKRLSQYHEILSRGIKYFPQHIRRCDVEVPRRGVNIIELQKFSRFSFLRPKIVLDTSCLNCPSEQRLQKVSDLLKTTIYNCKNLGSTVKSCPSGLRTHRDYLWWQDNHGTYYGHNTSCDGMTLIKGGWRTTSVGGPFGGSFSTQCEVCACSMDQNRTQKFDDTTIWRISVTDQISDFSNNMVVTGVRFITYDNALHLQIHQANFSHSGLAYNNSGWKKLDLNYNNRSLTLTAKNMSYEPLRYNRKTLYLDDIKVPEGYVVTGVGFKSAGNSAFKLRILATPYEFGTGKLSSSGSIWLDAPKGAMRSEDYERKRIEINLDHSDDPTRNKQFEYDSESNKLVNFTHTDVYKDAGQTTIPLLNAQSVIANPLFPLGGIGLSFRGKSGFGGYIAPRIYTVNVKNYMESIRKSLKIDLLTIENSPKYQENHYQFSLLNDGNWTKLKNTKYTIVE